MTISKTELLKLGAESRLVELDRDRAALLKILGRKDPLHVNSRDRIMNDVKALKKAAPKRKYKKRKITAKLKKKRHISKEGRANMLAGIRRYHESQRKLKAVG